MKVSLEDRKNFPSFQSCDEVSSVQKIKSWFMEDWSAKCSKPLCEPLPSDDFNGSLTMNCKYKRFSVLGYSPAANCINKKLD